MNIVRAALLAFAAAAIAGPAAAQNFGNIKPGTVIGNPDSTASKPAAPHQMSEFTGLIDPRSYGADDTGVNDSTAAFTSAINDAIATGATVSVPPGKFKVAALGANFTAASQAFSLKCAGQGQSTIYWPAAVGGLTVNYFSPQNAIHIDGCNFTTGQAGTGSAIKLQYTKSTSGISYAAEYSSIRNVTYQGDDGPQQAFYWGVGIDIINVTNVNIDQAMFYSDAGGHGIGVQIAAYNVQATTNAATSTSSPTLSFATAPTGVLAGMQAFDNNLANQIPLGTVLSVSGTTVTLAANSSQAVAGGHVITFQNAQFITNITNANFNGPDIGINYKTGAQGLFVSHCNFGDGIGIAVPANGFGLVQMTITDNQFETRREAIATGSFVTDTFISNNVFYVNDNTGTHPAVVLTQAARFIINGNSFVDKHVGGAAPTAITITNNQAGGGSGSGGVITANNFQAFAVGIQLGAQTGIQQGGIHVSGNNFVATTTSINDLGAGNKIIGQVLNASVAPGSPIPLTSTVTANITSLTLRPGNWMCNGIAEFTGATTTTVGTVTANITNTTAVVGDVPAGYAKTTFSGATPFTSATPITMTLSPINLNVSVDTPVFLNAAAIFAASTMSGYGGMNCVRLQ